MVLGWVGEGRGRGDGKGWGRCKKQKRRGLDQVGVELEGKRLGCEGGWQGQEGVGSRSGWWRGG